MILAVPLPHCLKAVTAVNTALLPKCWPAPKDLVGGLRSYRGTIDTGALVGWSDYRNSETGFMTRAHQTFRKVRDVVAGAGARTEHRARLPSHATRIDADLADPRGPGAAHRNVPGRGFPAATTAEGVRLVEPEDLFEIEAIAVLPGKRSMAIPEEF